MKPERRPCVSCGAMVPEHSTPDDCKPDCALQAEWRRERNGPVVEELRKAAKGMRRKAALVWRRADGYHYGCRNEVLLEAADMLDRRANKLARLDGRGRGKR